MTPAAIGPTLNIASSLVQRSPLLTTTNTMSTVSVSSMSNTTVPQPKVVSASKAKPKPRTPSAPKEKKISTSLREDDDINDVAAMGGVNLQEESQRMAASANEVGVQIRSCKDESFLITTGLTNRINRIGKVSFSFNRYREFILVFFRGNFPSRLLGVDAPLSGPTVRRGFARISVLLP